MHLIYSLALAVVLVLSAPLWLVQMLRRGKYRTGLGERWGRVPARILRGAEDCSAGVIWVHAVSVGEVLAVSGLITELRRAGGHRVVVSTTTATGQKLARQRFGDSDVFYFPLDFAFAIRPYLRALRPKLVIVAETEFWPNFLRLADQSGARLATVNARVSDRSFPRYSSLRFFVRRMLSHIDLLLAQTDEDARRLVAIGAPAERVRASGNLKFDFQPRAEPALVAAFRAAVAKSEAGPVVLCGSTLEGEEDSAIAAFSRLLTEFPRAVLVLAPRHPERFAAVVEILSQSGMNFSRRSLWDGETACAGGIFLLDTIGELGAMYALADVAFVGGSLAPRGGHNILEPAFFGVPIVVGPHTENFRDIMAIFRAHQAELVVRNTDELAATLLRLLRDPSERRQLGERAAAVVQANAGATKRTINALQSLLATPEMGTRRGSIDLHLEQGQECKPQ